MQKPTITVAIPSYNKEKEIRRCIESALKNSSEIDKIILVDNCSSDKTFATAQEYEPDITCYQNATNVGMAGNFNRCIELCDTDWLLILHADDELLEDSISKYRAAILENPSIGIIHADCYFIREDKIATKEYVARTTYGFMTAGKEAMGCHYGACSSIMVKMDAYNKLGNFLESLSSDVEMWVRIASRYDLFSMDKPTVIYHVSGLSTGPQSLVNRSIAEIKKDWDNLNAHIAATFVSEQERIDFEKRVFLEGPNNYWPVLTANIRAHNLCNVIDVLKVIIVDYRGTVPLLRRVGQYIYKYIRRIFHV